MIKCPRPTILAGTLNSDDTVVGSKMGITCQQGYALIGHNIITCLENGTWDKEMPVCTGDSDNCLI